MWVKFGREPMNRRLKLAAVGLAIVFVSFRACSLSSGAIDGVVLDESTGKPLADAIVVVTWMGDESKLVDSGSDCYHAETARTDANGKWHTPAWSRPWSSRNFGISLRGPQGEAYKPGYIFSYRPLPDLLLTPHKGTKDQYFEYLSKIGGRNFCAPDDESRKNLLSFYRSIAAEADLIAETPEQVRILRNLQSAYDHMVER
jgi:hypothetical protein